MAPDTAPNGDQDHIPATAACGDPYSGIGCPDPDCKHQPATAARQRASDQLAKWYTAGTLDDDSEWVRDMIEAMLDDPEHRCWADPDGTLTSPQGETS